MKEKIKKILKNCSKIFIIFIIFYFLILFELPFYIKKGGGIIDISERIEIEDSNTITGSYNMAYVSEIRASIPTYLIALLNKNWDIISKEEEGTLNESEKDAEIRGEVALKEANDTAIIVAYQKAKKDIAINRIDLIVTYIDEKAKTNLKVGDIILEVNEKKINNKSDLNNIMQSLEVGNEIKIKVKNNDKIYERNATVIEYENKKIIGVVIYQNYDLEFSPDIEFKFNKRESGSSGGLMMTLVIYDYLTKKDLSKGRKIAGTGTIDIDGNVGEINGVKYKLMGAYKSGADIFFVPSGENYSDAIKVMDENNIDIELVPVNTIDDAIKYLKD